MRIPIQVGSMTFTLVATTVDYPSEKIREEIIATGMMDGGAGSYDRLETRLRSLQ